MREAAKFEYGPTSTCAELYELRAKIKIALARFKDDAAKLERLELDIERMQDNIKVPRDKLTKIADRIIEAVGLDFDLEQGRRDLDLAQRVVAKAIQRNAAMRDHLEAMSKGVANSINRRCRDGQQPVADLSPRIHSFIARFAPEGACSTCTVYEVRASDPEGKDLVYTWKKTPPPDGDAAATNCGTFTPNGDKATWNHPNEGEQKCSHAAGEHPGWITVTVTDPGGNSASFTDKNGSADYTSP